IRDATVTGVQTCALPIYIGRELGLVVELGKRQRREVERGVAVRPAEDAEAAARAAEGRRVGHAGVGAAAEWEPDALAAIVARSVPDPVHRLRLCFGQAQDTALGIGGRRARPATDIVGRVELAGTRIRQDGVLQA